MVEYYTMQDIARRKSAAFANVAGYVTQKYTSFDMNSTAPTVTPGRIAKTQMQNEEIQTTIASAQGDHALLFFTQQGCSFCDKQKNILKFFNDKYDWPIKEMDIRANPDIAARFNITTTPTLLLIGKGKSDYIPVSVGVASLDTIEQKLYRGVRLMDGKITPQEYATFDYQMGGGGDPKATLQNNLNQSRQKK
jgi:conjugal transfer pilus assembly protein TraF